jgi:thymidylate kinase
MEWMVSPKPDRVFVLNVPAEVIHSRLRSRKVAKHEGDDILEKDAAVNRSINFVSWWYSVVKSMELDDDKLWFVDYEGNDMLKTIYDHILKDMHIATRS